MSLDYICVVGLLAGAQGGIPRPGEGVCSEPSQQHSLHHLYVSPGYYSTLKPLMRFLN